ncbi:AEC family transporter [Parvularcula lutaonensis]|uniref:AEC family transporter n=1 Tax=Parvularcula lutaonensis TaxID=491923 RepID=A0ABV7MB96_9PROT|nr:AEC family transporter [Parvularcula lutaonensis]GGY47676.1 transporter [Parvularcula lutaonensis]
MSPLVSLLVPLFGAIFLGAGCRALNLFDGEDARRMSRFVFMIAMPFAGFEFMRSSPVDGEILVGLGAGYLLSLAAASTAAFLIARAFLGLTIREAGAAVFSATCGNAIFLGIPIAASVEGWASPFLILVLFEGTVVFAIGSALMTWPEEDGEGPSSLENVLRTIRAAVVRALKSPIVLGTLGGLVAQVTHLPLPEPVSGFLAFMARTAGPVGLFVLGLSAADLLLSRKVGELKGAALLLPIKLLAFPALTAALVWLFTSDPTATAVAALFTGLPPAVASIVLSSVYRQWIAGVSGVVSIGTVLGLCTLAIYLFLVIPA